MFKVIIAILLLPLALTSPLLAAVLAPIQLLLLYIWRIIQGFLGNIIAFCFNFFNCNKKCRNKLIKDYKKYSSGNLFSNAFAIPALVLKQLGRPITWVFGSLYNVVVGEPINMYIQQATSDEMGTYFLYLVIFRCLRMIKHLYRAFRHSATPVPERPNVRPTDCTVILPTSDPRQNPDFEECLSSCLANAPGAVIVVTNSSAMVDAAKRIVTPYEQRFPSIKISVRSCHYKDATKRQQLAYALGYVRTRITVLLDEHVFWPSPRFLPSLIAPFDDEETNVGLVGTNKRVRRSESGYSFCNMLGALDLERQNFELRSTNALDTGVLAVSALTSAHRSAVVTNRRFLSEFANQCYFFGTFDADDGDIDAFITRWTVKQGFSVKIQHSADTCIETTVSSTLTGLLSQLVMQARSSWRNRCAALFTDRLFLDQPLTSWVVYLPFLYATALCDIAQIYTLSNSNLGLEPHALTYLISAILFSKFLKIAPYFLSHPHHLLLLPGYIIFTYLQSLLRVYAALTFFLTSSGPDRYAEAASASAPASLSPSPPTRALSTPAPPRANEMQIPLIVSPSTFLRPQPRDLAGVSAAQAYAYERHADRVARAVREDAPSPVSPGVVAAHAQQAQSPPPPPPKKRGRPRLTPNASPRMTPNATPHGSPALGAKRGRGRPRKNPL
ncbi:uncharacterized protein DSM5745_03731 [Aspergillus mulundensis]|uniref:Glycosyltransferase 2-like domain-containing protein n=1 Tax=Aspergillus mulundensis TaxID=1810919 RepID=A0A3D8SL81_9EURO|nr:hypothetical protein DSM5745_03731 [Aspergillus mulundensis]RDW87089.1 hypothetical protein DSM5745_03731 [Aspergillus mulundensis]